MSAATRRRARVDPELRRQLDRAAAVSPAPVEAVLRLRPAPATRRASRPLAPAASRDAVRELLARVADELGATASDYDFNVFPNLGYCVLSASPGFVECVLRQPEVASASANRRG